MVHPPEEEPWDEWWHEGDFTTLVLWLALFIVFYQLLEVVAKL